MSRTTHLCVRHQRAASRPPSVAETAFEAALNALIQGVVEERKVVSNSAPFLKREKALQPEFQCDAEIEMTGCLERLPNVVRAPALATEPRVVGTGNAEAADFLLDEPHRLRECVGVCR